MIKLERIFISFNKVEQLLNLAYFLIPLPIVNGILLRLKRRRMAAADFII